MIAQVSNLLKIRALSGDLRFPQTISCGGGALLAVMLIYSLECQSRIEKKCALLQQEMKYLTLAGNDWGLSYSMILADWLYLSVTKQMVFKSLLWGSLQCCLALSSISCILFLRLSSIFQKQSQVLLLSLFWEVKREFYLNYLIHAASLHRISTISLSSPYNYSSSISPQLRKNGTTCDILSISKGFKSSPQVFLRLWWYTRLSKYLLNSFCSRSLVQQAGTLSSMTVKSAAERSSCSTILSYFCRRHCETNWRNHQAIVEMTIKMASIPSSTSRMAFEEEQRRQTEYETFLGMVAMLKLQVGSLMLTQREKMEKNTPSRKTCAASSFTFSNKWKTASPAFGNSHTDEHTGIQRYCTANWESLQTCGA